MYISKLNFYYGMFSSNSFKLDRVIQNDFEHEKQRHLVFKKILKYFFGKLSTQLTIFRQGF